MLNVIVCAFACFVSVGLIYTVYRIVKSIVDTYPAQMH